MIRNLVNEFDLRGQEKMIDVGCGPGQLAIRLADWTGHITGVDVEEEMLREARGMADALKIRNIDWKLADIEEFIRTEEQESIKLVTMGKSFHWLNRSRFLEQLYPTIQRSGGIAVIDDYQPNKVLADWQITFQEITKKWYGEDRRAGKGIYDHPIQSHEEVIEESHFSLKTIDCNPYDHHWTLETLLGHHYSTSYGLKSYLGKNVDGFEDEVKRALLSVHSDGLFKEEIRVKVLLGYK
ncbi:class I SAM-dependent methyltransferase [Guptibacillus algicola]|uniref:class I SAM-dependent methyltransferase n=1 Tax=Guptibacillus algicola TaxID=225844 RepID=UPI001CD6CB8A|nr:class I SAM-dependent methyltransferase [Alkalihalobacillus algicola]MCA0985893.1 class I SAM-dependent methyltransferase [Alkalihalobacillus algicola]